MSPKQYAERLRKMDFLKDADNVYLTENYIVKQELSICVTNDGDSYSVSKDTYYLRTEERERDYLFAFRLRKRMAGKRIVATIYTRTYVD